MQYRFTKDLCLTPYKMGDIIDPVEIGSKPLPSSIDLAILLHLGVVEEVKEETEEEWPKNGV